MASKKTKRVTNPGIYVSGGNIEQSDYDTTEYKTLMQDYTDMRNSDSIASTSVDIVVYPILNSKFCIVPGQVDDEISPLAQEAADFVQWTYEELDSGLYRYLYHKFLALYYGMSMFEKVWKRGETYQGKFINRLIDLAPIQNDTIFKFNYDEAANFIGINQEQRIPERGFKFQDIDAGILHYYSPFMEYNNIQGRSMLRPSRMVYKSKWKIWNAATRAASRGAGLPEFQMKPTGNKDVDSKLKTDLETIAKNVGNSENAYIISQLGLVEFELHSLANQEANLALIQQANSEMFYNTQSQFVVSGIGGNGSRAATGEHKSPYYDMLNAVIRTAEDNEESLIEEIIDNSYFAGRLEDEEYPTAKIERPKDSDIIQTLTAFKDAVLARLVRPTAEDEVFIRTTLGLPENSNNESDEVEENGINGTVPMIDTTIQDTALNGAQVTALVDIATKVTTGELPKESAKAIAIASFPLIDSEIISNIFESLVKGKIINKKIDNIKPEEKPAEEKQISESEEPVEELKTEPEHKHLSIEIPDDVFELANAMLVMQTSEAKAEAIVNDVYGKIIEDIGIKLERDPNAEIKLPYKKEMYDRLASVFNGAYKSGHTDIRKEYAKIKGTTLSISPIQIEGNADRLVAKVDTLYSAIENSIKDELLLINKRNIDNAGGMRQYIIDRFGETQKQIKNDLVAISSGGYLSGRNDELSAIELIDPLVKRLYMTTLEGRQNVCEVCQPYNLMAFNREEAEFVGLEFDGDPINPLCMGGTKCRCTWRPTLYVTQGE